MDLVDPDLDPPEWHNLLLHTGEGVGRIQLDLVCPDLQARQMHAQRNAHTSIDGTVYQSDACTPDEDVGRF